MKDIEWYVHEVLSMWTTCRWLIFRGTRTQTMKVRS